MGSCSAPSEVKDLRENEEHFSFTLQEETLQAEQMKREAANDSDKTEEIGNQAENQCGRLAGVKTLQCGLALSRGNSSSHHLPLSVQNTLQLTYFPFHTALIPLPRIHLAANTESDIARMQRSVG